VFAHALARHEQSLLVNIPSVGAWIAGAGADGASKAALWSITNSLRVELTAQHNSVAGVHLGFTDTDMAAGFTAQSWTPGTSQSVCSTGSLRVRRRSSSVRSAAR
jgi:NAD(P)-dependent dehydrogenase (short-subunit alcohol dehydrogenase family)